jgi:protein-disulfide isomerase
VLKNVLTRHPNDIRVIFRHYPLDTTCNPDLKQQVHPSACEAAQAAECAGEQGQFWPYADLLFADQRRYSAQDLEAYASRLGLDMGRFKGCLAEGRGREAVRQDVEEANRIKVQVTPTLVVNGHKIEGGLSAEQFAVVIAVEKRRARGKIY